MALIRWEPTRELQTIQQEMNRLFGTFFDAPEGGGNAEGRRRWIPAMDVTEEGQEFVLRADLPGLREQDVNIEVEDNVLTISGERRSEHEDRKEGYYRVERAAGRFSRSLTLPEGVDPDSIQANFDNGVLTVRIPKPEERKPRRVAISVGEKAPTIEGSGFESSTSGSSSRQESGSDGERSRGERASVGRSS
jgi:HSP20 family protein